jgi:hypothetical protein
MFSSPALMLATDLVARMTDDYEEEKAKKQKKKVRNLFH